LLWGLHPHNYTQMSHNIRPGVGGRRYVVRARTRADEPGPAWLVALMAKV
jgi:hypothetical protein